MKRSVQTTSYLDMACEQWKTLCEIEAGACDSLTYEEIHEKFPEEFALRDQNKYHYRFPRGEVCFLFVCAINITVNQCFVVLC